MRRRADLLLVERGLFETRAKAQAAIAAGLVRADGVAVRKAAETIAADAAITAEPAHPFVSRGGSKLAHALDVFGIEVSGRDCLDIGASTGGFTDVLLRRGASRVTAVDVGTGQMHPRLAQDPRVRVFERTDARSVSPRMFAEPPTLLVADVSFVSLLKVLGPPLACLAPPADAVLLIKPQFEAGRDRVGKGGLVAPDVAEQVASEAEAALAAAFGLDTRGRTESPITGGDGNREWLVHLRRG